jgi:hypothetical protein
MPEDCEKLARTPLIVQPMHFMENLNRCNDETHPHEMQYHEQHCHRKPVLLITSVWANGTTKQMVIRTRL